MIYDYIYLKNLIEASLAEDIGSGDITTRLTVPSNSVSNATLTAKQAGVIAGIDVLKQVFFTVSADVKCISAIDDGTRVNIGDAIAVFQGRTQDILVAERVGLNFIQHLAGIATMTAKYVSLVAGTKAKIIDTRKTTPGIRLLEKYAVRVGGGFNHRFGLSDGILIKDNHIEAAGSITTAVKAAKMGAPHTLKIEVEVQDIDGLKEAIDAGADAVLLDNMSCEMLCEAVELNKSKVILEASGGIDESTVADIAKTGVDLISSGALTHSVKALDISLNIKAL